MSIFSSIPQQESQLEYFPNKSNWTFKAKTTAALRVRDVTLASQFLAPTFRRSELSGQCFKPQWIRSLHVNSAAEVVGFVPAAWSLTIWQLSRSKTQPVFDININRQTWPRPPLQFVLRPAGHSWSHNLLLVLSNQSLHNYIWLSGLCNI